MNRAKATEEVLLSDSQDSSDDELHYVSSDSEALCILDTSSPEKRTFLKCEQCRKRKKRLSVHSGMWEKGSKSDGTTCDFCGKRLPPEAGPSTSQPETTQKGGPYKNKQKQEEQADCPTCGKRMLKRLLKRHTNEVHLKQDKAKCSICKKQLSCARALKLHMMGVHEKIKDIVCPDCNFRCTIRSNMNRHRREVHDSEKRVKALTYVSCKICDAIVNENSMKRHIRDKHDGGRVWMCPHCEAYFGDHLIFKEHIAIRHTHMFNYECAFCSERYAEHELALQHVRQVHKDNPELMEDDRNTANKYLLPLTPLDVKSSEKIADMTIVGVERKKKN